MFTNHSTVTLFCSKKVGREKTWTRHILPDVNFHGSDQLLISTHEANSNDEYIIRVPAAALEEYVDSATWKALSVDEAENFFTFQKGDYIVKGIAENDVNTSAEILKNYETYEILRITENLKASKYSQHIKLVVK